MPVHKVKSLFQKEVNQNLNIEMSFVPVKVVSFHLVEWKMQAVNHTYHDTI